MQPNETLFVLFLVVIHHVHANSVLVQCPKGYKFIKSLHLKKVVGVSDPKIPDNAFELYVTCVQTLIDVRPCDNR